MGRRAFRTAARALARLGHRRIAMFRRPWTSPSRICAARAGLPPWPTRTCPMRSNTRPNRARPAATRRPGLSPALTPDQPSLRDGQHGPRRDERVRNAGSARGGMRGGRPRQRPSAAFTDPPLSTMEIDAPDMGANSPKCSSPGSAARTPRLQRSFRPPVPRATQAAAALTSSLSAYRTPGPRGDADNGTVGRRPMKPHPPFRARPRRGAAPGKPRRGEGAGHALLFDTAPAHRGGDQGPRRPPEGVPGR